MHVAVDRALGDLQFVGQLRRGESPSGLEAEQDGE
jgi:hypothetical protein